MCLEGGIWLSFHLEFFIDLSICMLISLDWDSEVVCWLEVGDWKQRLSDDGFGGSIDVLDSILGGSVLRDWMCF